MKDKKDKGDKPMPKDGKPWPHRGMRTEKHKAKKKTKIGVEE